MKLPVFICEDDPILLEKYTRTVKNAILIHQFEMTLTLATSDLQQILDYLKQNQVGDSLFFLDIDLDNELDGLDLSERIHQLTGFAQVVFVTAHQEYAFTALKRRLAPLDFIVKGQQEEQEIVAVLKDKNRDFRLHRGHSLQYLQIKVGFRKIRLNLDQVYYIETATTAHKLRLHGENLMYEFYGRLNELAVNYSQLLRVHKAYLINPTKVQTVDYHQREICFPENQRCYFSVKYMKKLRRVLAVQDEKTSS